MGSALRVGIAGRAAARAVSPEEWQEFLDLFRPHGVYPLLAYRLRARPGSSSGEIGHTAI